MVNSSNIQIKSLHHDNQCRRLFERCKSRAVIHLSSVDNSVDHFFGCRDISDGGISIHLTENTLILCVGQRIHARVENLVRMSGTLGDGVVVWVQLESDEGGHGWAGVMFDNEIDHVLVEYIASMNGDDD